MSEKTIEQQLDQIAEGAVKIQNAAIQSGDGYRMIQDAYTALRANAYEQGGEDAVHDVANETSRLDTDLVGLFIAVGLEPVLVASQGQGAPRWRRNPRFAERILSIIESGRLTTITRRRAVPHAAMTPAEVESGFHWPGSKPVAGRERGATPVPDAEQIVPVQHWPRGDFTLEG